MILPTDLLQKFKRLCPKYGHDCAVILVQRAFIAGADQDEVAEVICRFLGASEPAAAELAQRRLITPQSKAAVAEFIKRVARRLLVNCDALGVDQLSRILGVNRNVAFHMSKGTRALTADQIKLLVEGVFGAAAPSCITDN